VYTKFTSIIARSKNYIGKEKSQ